MGPLSDITPRMFAVEFERPSGSLAFSAIVLGTAPQPALEKAVKMFPEFRRVCRHGHVHEVSYVEIDWEIGRAFVRKRGRQLPGVQDLADARREPRAREREGGTPS